MTAGFVAALVGDWFLAIRGCDARTPGFLCGVTAFACAHLIWSAANWRESKVEWKTLPVVLFPLCGFFLARVRGNIPDDALLAVSAYAVVSAISLAIAVGTRRWFYAFGIGCLVLSDVFIACQWAHASFWGSLVGPFYIAALLLVATSCVLGRREQRFVCGKGNPIPVTVVGGALSAGFFVWAMLVCPGGGYNPLTYMLSYLGRTTIKGVSYPLSHYLFCFGMSAGSAASLYFAPHFRSLAPGRVRREIVGWGMAVCVAGLLLIMFVPEDVNMVWHLNGCYLTMIGGIPMAVALACGRTGWIWLVVMATVAALFELVLFLDKVDVIPFSPAVPTMQKCVIVSFVLWQLAYALRLRRHRECKERKLAK